MLRAAYLALAMLSLAAACSAQIVVEPPCQGEGREACVQAKSQSFQFAVGKVERPDILYRAYEYGCELPDADACWMLGRLLSGDKEFVALLPNSALHALQRDDRDASRRMIAKSCDLGSVYGCLLHSADLLESHVQDDVPMPLDVEQRMLSGFYASCLDGFLSGCGGFIDAVMAFEGTSLDQRYSNLKDHERFASRQVCDAGIGTGCTLLAFSLAPDAADEIQREEVRSLMRKSCELDDEWGCRSYVELFTESGSKERNWGIRQACAADFSPETWNVGPDITGCNQ